MTADMPLFAPAMQGKSRMLAEHCAALAPRTPSTQSRRATPAALFALRLLARSRIYPTSTTALTPERPTHDDRNDPDSARPPGGARRRRPDRAPAQHRALDRAGARRRRARPRTRAAAHRACARIGPAGDPAAADLFGRRRHELARVPFQPAADRAARLRLRRVHDLRDRGGDALRA